MWKLLVVLGAVNLVEAKFFCLSGEEVSSSVLCNGHKDCLDGTDETQELCVGTVCDAGEFKCFYGGCIHRHQVCNGAPDCADGSEETQCGKNRNGSCESTEFRCGSGQCIASKLICDGSKDCQDGSDESKVVCEHKLCPQKTFRCRYGSCIHEEVVCNGFYDCIDGSDETVELCSKANVSCPAILSTRLDIKCENSDGIVPCTGFIKPGTVATYSCKDFYEPRVKEDVHNNASVCQQNGVWSRNILKCHARCGKTDSVTPLVVNGVETRAPFPWHASMFVHRNGNWTFWCGGSLITEALFITAAHCTHSLTPAAIKMALGKFRRDFEVAKDETQCEFYDVKNIIEHPLYLDQNGNYASDVAMLEIVGSVAFSEKRMPVCLDWKLDDITSHLGENSVGFVMGLGLNEKDVFSDIMRLTSLHVVPNDKCIEKHAIDFKKYVTVTSFCAGWLNGTGVCNGDSGGGLVFHTKGTDRWTLQGIVSLSPRRESTSFCDPFQYTVFTKVGLYVKWVEHVVEEVHATHNFTRKKYQPII